MNRPISITGCPPGLEYLTVIDKIQCTQMISLTEVLFNYEKNNKYVIANKIGQQIFHVAEESNFWMR
jgi:hypothetical protein